MKKKESQSEPDFLIVPMGLIRDREATRADIVIYAIIYWYTRMKGERCFASNTTLAKLAGTSSGVVRNTLTKLEKNGYIKRVFSDGQRKYREEIIPLIRFTRVSSGNDTCHQVMTQVSSTSDTGVSSIGAQNSKSIELEDIHTPKGGDDVEKIDTNRVINLFKMVNPSYTDFFKNKTHRKAAERMVSIVGSIDDIENMMPIIAQTNTMPYAPVITRPTEFVNNYAKLVLFMKRHSIERSNKTLKIIS